ncbi:hypothetical protein [Streptomyces sp. KL2]|uniref:hypothetical protein n=1 Tax=Streptomyces sp. KL2 TaxID=3050126 RepID=UPI0039793420
MPSVTGLLEQREPGARRRVDELREEADRIQAESAMAEREWQEWEWQEWAIARRRVDMVLAPNSGDTAETEAVPDVRDTDAPSAPWDAVKPKPQVPVWCEGLSRSTLSVDYQRILTSLADRCRLGQGPLNCQETASGFGMDVVPTQVEGLRSKSPKGPTPQKRLVAHGWVIESAPGRFTLAAGAAGPGGGS